MKKIITNKSGAALIYVLIMMVVLTVLGLALLSTGLFENKVSIVEKNILRHIILRSRVHLQQLNF